MSKHFAILVPTIPKRAALLARLMSILQPQVDANPSAHVFTLEDDGSAMIGQKRNALLAMAEGFDYVAFVDDDDVVAQDYVPRIMRALELRPDTVGFCGVMTLNGRRYDARPFFHSMQIKRWLERDGVYYRPPNHLNPVRHELAAQVRFIPINFGEDQEYSRRLLPLVQSEVFVGPPSLYWYDYHRHDCRHLHPVLRGIPYSTEIPAPSIRATFP